MESGTEKKQMSGRRQRRSYTDEFRAGAVRLVLVEGRSVSQVAADLDLTRSALDGWVKQAKANAGKGPVGALTSADREELTRLRREVKVLRMERDILKKAAAFFAKENALEEASTTWTPEGLASQPTLSRMQAMLASAYNRRALADALAEHACARNLQLYGIRAEVTFDVDSLAIETHGEQDGAAYNGHYRTECYHPLVAYTDTRDMLGVQLRPGNVHTAHDVRRFLGPLLDHVRTLGRKVWLRMDCGYANGKLLAWLEERNVTFITRLRTNPALQAYARRWRDRTLAAWRATPSVDGRPREATHEIWYRPRRRTRVVRVVAVLVERDATQGELLHHTFFLASNAARPEATSAELLTRYRERGIAEQRIGEFIGDIAPTVSSVPRARQGSVARKRPVALAENEVSLLLAVFACNLLHTLRSALDPVTAVRLSVRRLRERLLRTAATVTRHARQVTVRINPVHVPLWSLIARYLPPAVPAREDLAA